MKVPTLDQRRFLSFTVIAEPLENTAAGVAEVFKQFQLRRPMIRSDASLELDRIYVGSPPNGGAHAHNIVLYAPVSDAGSTVIVTNSRDGWSSLSHVLARRLGAKQAQVKQPRTARSIRP